MTDRANPDIILRNIKPELYEQAFVLTRYFVRDWPDKAAGDFVLYSQPDPKAPPSCEIHWTKAGNIVVRALNGWAFSP